MKILQLISSGGLYGIETMLLGLASGLQRQGEDVIVGVFHNSQNPNLEIADALRKKGITVEIIPCSGRADRNSVKEIRRIAEKHSVQIIHSHGFKADLYALAAARKLKAPLMATCHNWPGTSRSLKAYAAIDRWALRHFSRVVIISEHVAERLRRAGVSPNKILNIPNGVNTRNFRDRSPAKGLRTGNSREVVIGYVGRLVPEKGCSVLLQAAAQVVGEFPEARLIFVGEGPERSFLEAESKSWGLERNVIFAGRREDMPEVYAAFDICVLPSFAEAMPMTILEAMASGNAIIATYVGEIPNMVTHDETGILVQPHQISELRDAILRLLRDENLRRSMGQRGAARIQEKFSLERMAHSYMEIYRQIADAEESRAGAEEFRAKAHTRS
jgi:glycosyltransferase involved in cell wall biosynthesis